MPARSRRTEVVRGLLLAVLEDGGFVKQHRFVDSLASLCPALKSASKVAAVLRHLACGRHPLDNRSKTLRGAANPRLKETAAKTCAKPQGRTKILEIRQQF